MGTIKEFYHEEICQGLCPKEILIQDCVEKNEIDLEKEEKDLEDQAFIEEVFKLYRDNSTGGTE